MEALVDEKHMGTQALWPKPREFLCSGVTSHSDFTAFQSLFFTSIGKSVNEEDVYGKPFRKRNANRRQPLVERERDLPGLLTVASGTCKRTVELLRLVLQASHTQAGSLFKSQISVFKKIQIIANMINTIQ